ncbi:helix-turn-helix domain-containing protein [Paenibacillus tarimensis]
MVSNINIPSDYAKEKSGIIIAGHFDEPDTYRIERPNGRNDWLITFTLGGQGYYKTPGYEHICRSGDLTLLKPGTPHCYGTSPGSRWNFVWTHFAQPLTETSLLPDEELLIQHIESDSVRKRIYRAFRRVLADSAERTDYWQELCCSSLSEILLLAARRVCRPVDPRIEEIRHLLTLHMREPIRLGELAGKVGLSASRLSHLFKQNTGLSVIEALNQMRIRQAALLLEHTERNANEVAHDVGFHNYNHFANQFRKRYGVSPSAFVRSKRQP